MPNITHSGGHREQADIGEMADSGASEMPAASQEFSWARAAEFSSIYARLWNRRGGKGRRNGTPHASGRFQTLGCSASIGNRWPRSEHHVADIKSPENCGSSNTITLIEHARRITDGRLKSATRFEAGHRLALRLRRSGYRRGFASASLGLLSGNRSSLRKTIRTLAARSAQFRDYAHPNQEAPPCRLRTRPVPFIMRRRRNPGVLPCPPLCPAMRSASMTSRSACPASSAGR